MSSTVEIKPEVAAVLEAAVIDGTALRLTGQLDRKLYVDTNRIIELLGGKWSRKLKAHVFTDVNDVQDAVDSALSQRAVVDRKKLYQFFETPDHVARELVRLADVQMGSLVLEPSAGRGAILMQILACNPTMVEVYELDPANRDYLRMKFPEVAIYGDDFLESSDRERYTAIIANPPFSRLQDVKHVNHMLDMLKPGGRLATVMSPALTFRNDKAVQDLKAKLDDQMASWHLIELPAGTFRSSGTDVRTIIVHGVKA